MAFSGESKRRDSFFRILELPSITIKKKKHFFDKKIRDLLIVEVTWALVCIKSLFFFVPFFTLFSILLGNSDAFGGIQSNILANEILMFFWHHFERNTIVTKGTKNHTFCFFCSFFLLQFLLVFEEIE